MKKLQRSMVDIVLGSAIRHRGRSGPEMICDPGDPLVRHIRRPWFVAYAERQLGERLRKGKHEARYDIVADDDLFAKHTLMVAGTGSGKTRTTRLILSQQMQLGYSVVAFAPKFQDVVALAGDAQAAGLRPEQVIIVSPNLDYVPCMNVLDAGLPLTHAAGDLAAPIIGSAINDAPRMSDLVQHALIIVGAHKKSAYELMRFLQRDDYRRRLIHAVLPDATSRFDRMAYHESVQYFRAFAAWSKTEQATALAPALTRLGQISRSWFLQALYAAGRSTIDLPSFWQRQQLLIVHNDVSALGSETCARFVASSLMSAVFRTAMREPGHNPVILALDELASTERLVGQTIIDALTLGRSIHLRLITSLQFLSQTSGTLREALISQPNVQIFGRLGSDARLVAASLVAGTGRRLKRVAVASGPSVQLASVRYPICDSQGRPLKLSAAVWQQVAQQIGSAERLALITHTAAKRGISGIYVADPMKRSLVAVGRYLHGLAPEEYDVIGPSPLALAIQFPQPHFSGLTYHTEHDRELQLVQLLQSISPQQAVIRLAGRKPMLVRLADVPDRVLNERLHAFMRAAGRANGNSPAEIDVALEHRQAAVDGKHGLPKPSRKTDDGSLF